MRGGGGQVGTEASVRGGGVRSGAGARACGGGGQVSAEALAYGSGVHAGAEALTRGGHAEPGWSAGGAGQRGGIGVPVLLVPVPSARRAVRARGHDPARRIALSAAAELRRAGMPTRVAAVLRQRRGVADQSGLNSRQRLENLAGALMVAPGGERLLTQGLVVLVDDLMTTGASLTEAARAVREARLRENTERAGEQARRHGEQTAFGNRDQRQHGRGGPPGHEQRATAGGRGGRSSGREVDGCGGEGAGVVYTAATREGMGERMVTVTEEDTGRERRSAPASGAGGVHDAICAAVVAAPPDSFGINRN
ncbi:ComF family protein [Streptomyces sp. NBC_00285]|nr:ComF family protein [Streptomyces sp. NBC_00285]